MSRWLGEGGGGLAAAYHNNLQVNDAEGLSAREGTGPGRARGNHLIVDHGSGKAWGGAHRA